MGAWDASEPGVVVLPSGRSVRGRGLRTPLPAASEPDFGLYLTGRHPSQTPWPQRWVRWPDFWLPLERAKAQAALAEAWERAGTSRVEIACGSGLGRTGTALACVAVIDGVAADEAVAWVRRSYHPRAVETPWQRRFVARSTTDG